MTIRARHVVPFLLAAALVAALVPWSFPDALLRHQIIAQIEAQTGLETETVGRATFSLLPQPRVTIENVAVRDKAGALQIEARAVTGDIRLVSLLRGRIELKAFVLDTPTLSVDLDAEPFGQRGAIARALSAAPGSPEAARADKARLANVTVTAGLMRVNSATRGVETLIQEINATLDWPRVGNPAVLSGSAVWRGRPAQFDAAVARPGALLRGEQSSLTFHVHGPAAELDADGLASTRPRTQFQGTVRAHTTSLRNVARMLGLTLPLPGSLEDAAIEADTSATGTTIWLTNAKLSLDGNAFEGSLAINTDAGHMAVSGTLATDLLHLDTFAEAVPPLLATDGQWSHEPFELHDLVDSELDLRVSAAKMRFGGVQAEDAALSVLLKAGRMELTIAEAQMYKGSLKARAVGSLHAPDYALKINGSFSKVDVGTCLVAAFDTTWLDGSGTGQFQFQAMGDSPAAMFASLEGRADFGIVQGEITGINVEQALRRIEKRPLLSASDVHNGRTSFDAASATASILHGSADIRDGTVSGPGARIAFAGTASLVDRTIALRAQASQTGSDGGVRAAGPELAFGVTGTWDDPAVEPDAESLIRRSDAAAPLFRFRSETDAPGTLPVEPAAPTR